VSESSLPYVVSVVILATIAWMAADIVADIIRGPINWLLRKSGLQQASSGTNTVNNLNRDIVGINGVVIKKIDKNHGRVKAGHSEWLAELDDGQEPLDIGSGVIVTCIKDGVLVVRAIEDESV